MGVVVSHQLSVEALTAYQEATGLSTEQLEQLHQRFRALDRRQRGYLTPTDLLRIPQLSQNPLHHQIIDGFFAKTPGTSTAGQLDRINFGQFLNTCATFLVPQFDMVQRPERSQKMRLLSKMFDTQRCGYLIRSDFRRIMMSLLDTAPPFEGSDNIHNNNDNKDKNNNNNINTETELQQLEDLAFGNRQSIPYELFEQRLTSVDADAKLNIRKWLEPDNSDNPDAQDS